MGETLHKITRASIVIDISGVLDIALGNGGLGHIKHCILEVVHIIKIPPGIVLAGAPAEGYRLHSVFLPAILDTFKNLSGVFTDNGRNSARDSRRKGIYHKCLSKGVLKRHFLFQLGYHYRKAASYRTA